jgi:hypothetical protein
LPHEPLREPTLRVFGPGFAELAPEFSASGYEPRGMPPENLWVNVSRSSDPRQVPWAHWIKALPKSIGIHEGGAGAFKGTYRPTVDGCILRGPPSQEFDGADKGGRDFCPVCREAILLKIYQRVSPVDDATPGVEPLRMDFELMKEQEILVQVKQPATHEIQVKFYYSPVTNARPVPQGLRWHRVPDEAANPERRTGRKEPPSHWQEVGSVRRHDGRSTCEVLDVKKLLRADKAKPGHYAVVALVSDPASVRHEKWVLKDPDQLLTELLVWEIVVEREQGQGISHGGG